MDELVHHCLREIAFDGNLGMSLVGLVEKCLLMHDQVPV